MKLCVCPSRLSCARDDDEDGTMVTENTDAHSSEVLAERFIFILTSTAGLWAGHCDLSRVVNRAAEVDRRPVLESRAAGARRSSICPRAWPLPPLHCTLQ